MTARASPTAPASGAGRRPRSRRGSPSRPCSRRSAWPVSASANFAPDRPWNYLAYGLAAPYVAWLVWRRRPRARFAAYVFLTHEAVRGIHFHRRDAVAIAALWVLLLQLPGRPAMDAVAPPRRDAGALAASTDRGSEGDAEGPQPPRRAADTPRGESSSAAMSGSPERRQDPADHADGPPAPMTAPGADRSGSTGRSTGSPSSSWAPPCSRCRTS